MNKGKNMINGDIIIIFGLITLNIGELILLFFSIKAIKETGDI